jgi:hypothetical protein
MFNAAVILSFVLVAAASPATPIVEQKTVSAANGGIVDALWDGSAKKFCLLHVDRC